jgi:hypothetical protein
MSVALLAAACGVGAAALAGGGRPAPRPAAAPRVSVPPVTAPVTTTTVATTVATVRPTTTKAPPRRAAPTTVAARPATLTLAGCPPPPSGPSAPSPPPWHPAVLVPDSKLPPASLPAPWRSNVTALTGTGMWIWQWPKTDGGDASAVVRQARAAHLHQLWVRVGDSMNGFYGKDELDELVPAAHAAGLSVIAWGFPYLYDPVGDAGWTARILAWRGPGGQQVDGYSADIERPSEGVDLTARRVGVYLQEVRRSAGSRLIVATVYPPSDSYWLQGGYPFSTMAHYVDAFAPMIYWECTDPGADAEFDVGRLATLRPVHIIGQAFNMADVGGRAVAPSGAEITEFLQDGRKAGAVGASLWVWQDATPQEWAAISAYRW